MAKRKQTPTTPEKAASEAPQGAPGAPDAEPSTQAATDEKAAPTGARKRRGGKKGGEAGKNEAPKAKAKRAAKKAKAAGDGMTLAELSEAYLKHLEEFGKSRGTVFSYSIELNLAMKELGADRPIADLTVDDVKAFFECARVTRKRNGQPKSRVGVEKTRRVFRQALEWAEAEAIIITAPIPEIGKEEKPKK